MGISISNPSYDKVYTAYAWRYNSIFLNMTQGEGIEDTGVVWNDDGTIDQSATAQTSVTADHVKSPRFQLRDDRGILDLTGCQVVLAVKRPKGTEDLLACYIEGNASDGTISCPITRSSTAIEGRGLGEIRVLSNNAVIKFFGVHFNVYKGVSDLAAEQSTQFSALVSALQKVALVNPDGSNTVAMDTEVTENGTNPVASGLVYNFVYSILDDTAKVSYVDEGLLDGATETGTIYHTSVDGSKALIIPVSGNSSQVQFRLDRDGKIYSRRRSRSSTSVDFPPWGSFADIAAAVDPDDIRQIVEDYIEAHGIDLTGVERTENRVNAINAQSDDETYPTAGAVLRVYQSLDEADANIRSSIGSLESGKANKSETYTKTQVDAALSGKANTSDIPDVSGKADKATTLAGYGITDAYKKVDINQMFNQVDADLQGKADAIDTYTKSEVDSLVSGGVVPQYVIDEAESVLAKAFAHKGLGRTIRFIAVSDSHNDATEVSYAYTHVSNQHCGQAVKYIADRIPLDFVAFLGDMTWAGVAHTTAQYQTDWLKEDIQEMNSFLKDGFSGVPNIRVVGNHDQCATTDSGGTVSRLQNGGAYQYFGRYNAGVSDGLSNYGYYDLDNVKVRIIYLNTSDTVNVSSQGTYLGMTAGQKNWLCETLIDLNTKTDAASWKILLMSHAPLDMISGLAADILIPYTNGGTYGSYTFTNHSAKIVGNCHGHTHCYNVGYISDKIRRFTIPNSNFYDNNHYKNNANYAAWNEETTYPKTQNSRTDTSFSLVTIDLDSLTCYVDNYGAGYDREFSLDYKPAPGPANLFDKDDSDVVIGGRFNSSHSVVYYQDNELVTGFIPATTTDTFHVESDLANNQNAYVGEMNFYNANKEYIGRYRSPKESQNAGLSPTPTWAADYLSGDFDLSKTADSGTSSGAAYVRFCIAYTGIDSIVITK